MGPLYCNVAALAAALFLEVFKINNFIYPEDLKAKPTFWLWQLRDVVIAGAGLLFSVIALLQTGSMLPLVATALFAFLTIQVSGSSVLDFLRYAVCFLLLRQQFYIWKERET